MVLTSYRALIWVKCLIDCSPHINPGAETARDITNAQRLIIPEISDIKMLTLSVGVMFQVTQKTDSCWYEYI